ncbi:hypothetical protein F5J12DRAFT_785309 [Pisolithus orientalis]|uniref:uncharacterized protein n=1 Tax=Pisolithus orientalis TaxID=936130 RepID=UPI0022258EDB|nr:uncharacterized protein F5J12DRAFT_785309 [Pisolithus orientalis]KAI5996895.1 hypothetical protein F5J12DRAFT_785309 [Pisolithus orientalis]
MGKVNGVLSQKEKVEMGAAMEKCMGGGNSTGMTESRFSKGLIVLDIYPDDITVVGTNIYGNYSEKMAQVDQEDGFMSWGRRGSLDGPNSLFGFVYHVIYHVSIKIQEINMPQEHAQQVIAATKPGNYGAFGTCILEKYNNHWITSPNADFVPEPFLFEGKTIMLCFCQDDLMWSWMWWNMRNVPEDFALERGLGFRVGRVHLDKWKHLEIIFSGNQIHEAADIFGPEFMKATLPLTQQQRARFSGTHMSTISASSWSPWTIFWCPVLWLNVESEWLDQVHQIFLGDSELTMFAEPSLVKD